MTLLMGESEDENEDEERAAMARMETVDHQYGGDARFALGCILAFSSKRDDVSPEHMMDVFIGQMDGRCTGGHLQIGTDKLMEYQPGERSPSTLHLSS